MAEIFKIKQIIGSIEGYEEHEEVVLSITKLPFGRKAGLGISDVIKIVEILEGDKEILRVLRNVAIIMGKPRPENHKPQMISRSDEEKWFGSVKCTTREIVLDTSTTDKEVSLNEIYKKLAQADIKDENEFLDCFMAMILVQGYSMKNWAHLSDSESPYKRNRKVDQEKILNFMVTTLIDSDIKIGDDYKNKQEDMKKFM
ncbi:unnamed protein product [Cylicocyclus nassatus]|uniref:Uncharacterized protein n=1 Tax=Cylicocyclus nassatus TaxID=53992 RepID=A0AA36H1L1_CYLNA|nr:unnamed protein product [Cylicocyclus nassatus]